MRFSAEASRAWCCAYRENEAHPCKVLVSYCCCNKLYQLSGLTQHKSLIVLEVRAPKRLLLSPNQGCPGCDPSEDSRLFPCHFQLLEALFVPWLVTPSSVFKARVASSSFSLPASVASQLFFILNHLLPFHKDTGHDILGPLANVALGSIDPGTDIFGAHYSTRHISLPETGGSEG